MIFISLLIIDLTIFMLCGRIDTDRIFMEEV